MGTHQIQWVHSQNTLVVVTDHSVQVVYPQCLSRLNVIESDLVRLDVSLPPDLLVQYHEGSKRQSSMIGDPLVDLESLRWPAKEV